jgi:hypothetical protein
MLIQLHWQDRADPEKTELVAQGEFADSDAAMAWATELIERRGKEMPEGWCPLLCDEDSNYFVRAAP